MKAKIYRTSKGFDIITSDRRMYHHEKETKYIGIVNKRFQPSGKLLREVPIHLRELFYKLQEKPLMKEVVE